MLCIEWKITSGRRQSSCVYPWTEHFYALPILHGSTGCQIKNHKVWRSNAKLVRWRFADLLHVAGECTYCRVFRLKRHRMQSNAIEKMCIRVNHSSSPLLQNLSSNPIVTQMIHFTSLTSPTTVLCILQIIFQNSIASLNICKCKIIANSTRLNP